MPQVFKIFRGGIAAVYGGSFSRCKRDGEKGKSRAELYKLYSVKEDFRPTAVIGIGLLTTYLKYNDLQIPTLIEQQMDIISDASL